MRASALSPQARRARAKMLAELRAGTVEVVRGAGGVPVKVNGGFLLRRVSKEWARSKKRRRAQRAARKALRRGRK